MRLYNYSGGERSVSSNAGIVVKDSTDKRDTWVTTLFP